MLLIEVTGPLFHMEPGRAMPGKFFLLVSVLVGAIVLLAIGTSTANAHRSGCHRWHSCPSDTGSYVCGDTGYSNFCPRTAPSTKQPTTTTPTATTPSRTPAVEPADKSDVRTAQRLLTELGHDPGPVDGVLGPKTRIAIMQFQINQGIKLNGEVSDDLIVRLARAAGRIQ